MTYLNPKDPAIGKVHRERKGLTQHYLLSGWRGIEYRLTGRFAGVRLSPRRNDTGVLVTPLAILSEAKGHDGSLLWSDHDGNHYPSFVPGPSIIWSEEINWPTPTFEALQDGLAELMKPVSEMTTEELLEERRKLKENLPTFGDFQSPPKM